MKKFWHKYGYCISMCSALTANRFDDFWPRVILVGIFVGLAASFVPQKHKDDEI